MLSNEEICRRLSGLPEYERLKSQRRRLAFACAGLCLGLCAGFILAAVLWPAALAHPLNDQGTVTSGLLYAVGLILLSWLLTGAYIHIANSRFDPMRDRLLAQVRP